MPEFTDGGVSDIGGNDVVLFRSNVSAFDRALINKMKGDSVKLKRYQIPVASTPKAPKIQMNIDSIRAQKRMAKKAITAKLNANVANVRRDFKKMLKAGADPKVAAEDARKKIAYAKAQARKEIGDMRRSSSALAKDIKKAMLRQAMMDARTNKSKAEAQIRNIEQQVRKIKELMASGKLNMRVGEEQVRKYNQQIAKILRDQREDELTKKEAVIDQLVKMGQMSTRTADKLKMRARSRASKALTAPGIRAMDSVSYIPIDIETGRIISPMELDKQIAYRMAHGMKARRLRSIRNRLGRPENPNVIKVRIKLISQARMSRPEPGEGVVMTKEAERIPVKKTAMSAPENPVPAEDVPSSRFKVRGKGDKTNYIRQLHAQAANLMATWKAAYDEGKDVGIGKDTQVVMYVGQIQALKNEIRNARSTAMTPDDIANKYKQLIMTIKSAIQDLRIKIAEKRGGA